MKLKVISGEAEYKKALARLDELMVSQPAPVSDAADELGILAVLLEDYEKRRFPVALPSPIDAILFRMEQAGLTQRDLIPFIGSRSKVSEVLSGKRPLSLGMIRALSEGLGIPGDVLLQEDRARPDGDPDAWVQTLPVREIVSRQWVIVEPGESREAAVKRWILPTLSSEYLLAARQTRHVRTAKQSDEGSLLAWTARVLERSSKNPPTKYVHGTINQELMSRIVRLSADERGPVLARDFLAEQGVGMVIEPHLPRTHLDGAAIWCETGPVIGLTLRHDRIDNFWFTVLHEVAHLWQMDRTGNDVGGFYDDLDAPDRDGLEVEADATASEVMIPTELWEASPASRLRSPEAVNLLAGQLGISPAIVAGRIRHKYRNYRVLSRMVGTGQVRRLFHEEARQ